VIRKVIERSIRSITLHYRGNDEYVIRIDVDYTRFWPNGETHDYVKSIESDYDVCHLLDIPMTSYKEKLLKEFNGFLCNDYETSINGFNCYFKSEEDCMKAVDWLNSILVMKKLTG